MLLFSTVNSPSHSNTHPHPTPEFTMRPPPFGCPLRIHKSPNANAIRPYTLPVSTAIEALKRELARVETTVRYVEGECEACVSDQGIERFLELAQEGKMDEALEEVVKAHEILTMEVERERDKRVEKKGGGGA